jgi:hypothetical protein
MVRLPKFKRAMNWSVLKIHLSYCRFAFQEVVVDCEVWTLQRVSRYSSDDIGLNTDENLRWDGNTGRVILDSRAGWDL